MTPTILCRRHLIFLLTTVITNILICVLTSSQLAKADDVIVKTSKGKVQGKTVVSALGKEVEMFLGIPFAKPPVGKLRFQRPQPMDPWKDVFNATAPPNTCVQIVSDRYAGFKGATVWNPNTPLSEDCLTLNVYVPKPRPKGSAVLVWIYGGGFYTGGSVLDVYDPKIMCTEGEIIVVSINYRLASLGFLFFDRPDVPGNVGLFDQLMALEWINENIVYFGGNPDNITLFGESAGAASVGFHLLSPRSRYLFSRAIMESSAPVCPWAITDKEEMIKRGLRLAASLKCPHDRSDMDAVVECLRTKDPSEIVSNEWLENYRAVELPFTPVVDGDFVEEMPQQSLNTKNFKKTNIMMGSNTNEGTYFVLYYMTDYFRKEEDVYLNRQQFIDATKELYPYVGELGQDSIMFQYTDWKDPMNNATNRDAISYMVGDLSFICGVNDMAYGYAESGNDVYMYYFNHRSSLNPWPKWMGTLHGDEINFVYGEPLNPSFGYTEDEVKLSRRMLAYWVNFAKTGNPNLSSDGKTESVNWPLHTASGREYLTLAVNSSEVGNARRATECAFWKDHLPKIVQQTYRQKPPTKKIIL